MESNFEQTLRIARTYMDSHKGAVMPPMIIGYTATGEYVALLGTFRDFQEQLTFCTVARMGFLLYNISEYHVLTHGDMTFEDGDGLSHEIIMDAVATKEGPHGKIYRIERDFEGNIAHFVEEMKFEPETDGIEGLFMSILPTVKVNLPTEIATGIEGYISQIRYIAPETEVVLPVFPEPVEVEPEMPSALRLLQGLNATV